MNHLTFIQPAEAFKHLADPAYRFIDCSYALADKSWGAAEYQKSHIPGALYADLHEDLAGEIRPGAGGRHPLPAKEDLVKLFSSYGIDANTQVVAYDSTSGFMAAARLWWLLKWAGHDKVAVLAGGKPAWQSQGFPLTAEASVPPAAAFKPAFRDELLASADEVLALDQHNSCLVDSRTADRYAGQNETIDPVAGHIPGAISKPFNANINAQGEIADPAALKEYFAKDFEKGNTVFYCGSGVTAAFNILLAVHAGYPFPKLYAGSWSEWITDPKRPVA